MGMQLGYTMMTEQAGPKDLVAHAVGAEETGFDFVVSSDHYFPWLDEMGHAPNAWVTLGAVAQATSRIDLMTYVTCPIMRYRPAVVAQQAATLGVLSGGRFTLGLGAGRTSTSTSSARAGRRSPSGRRCSARPSRSSASCSAATATPPTTASTSTWTAASSGTCPRAGCRSASRCPARSPATWPGSTPTR